MAGHWAAENVRQNSMLKGKFMAIKEFELFHGVVLTKILRSDRPVSFLFIENAQMIQVDVYTINDEIELFIKHSISPRALSRGKGGYSWIFTFSPDHITQLQKLQTKRPALQLEQLGWVGHKKMLGVGVWKCVY